MYIHVSFFIFPNSKYAAVCMKCVILYTYIVRVLPSFTRPSYLPLEKCVDVGEHHLPFFRLILKKKRCVCAQLKPYTCSVGVVLVVVLVVVLLLIPNVLIYVFCSFACKNFKKPRLITRS